LLVRVSVLCVPGVRADGSPKLRAIDDFTRSRVNERTYPTEKLRYESIESLLALLRLCRSAWGDGLALYKADIDSAYRRIYW